MEPKPKKSGKIVTFYSYKGGVGRSMALANIAWLLADHDNFRGNKNDRQIIVIDWDLEAPGLHKFLGFDDAEIKTGLLDLLYDYKDFLQRETTEVKEDFLDLKKYIVPIPKKYNQDGRLFIIPAGGQDKDYAAKVNKFDWKDFYENWHGYAFMDYFQRKLRERAEIILIDSRTGLTDISGICTMQLPDLVVLKFSLNRQNVDGIYNITNDIMLNTIKQTNRKEPPQLLFVPSRVDITEKELSDEWLVKAAKSLEPFIHTPGDSTTLETLTENIVIYRPYYSFGEKLAVKDNDFLLAPYVKKLTDKILVNADLWYEPKAEIKSEAQMVFGNEPMPDAEYIESEDYGQIKKSQYRSDTFSKAGGNKFNKVSSISRYLAIAILIVIVGYFGYEKFFSNPSFSDITEKVLDLKYEIINQSDKIDEWRNRNPPQFVKDIALNLYAAEKLPVDSAIVNIGLGQYERAIRNLDNQLELLQANDETLAATFEEILLLKGIALYFANDTDGALENLNEALIFNDENPDIWYFRGNIFRDWNTPDSAIYSYSKALSFDEGHYLSWNGRGKVHANLLNNPQYAIDSYYEALHYKHEYDEAWANLATVLYSQKRFDEALQNCDSALKYNPDNHVAVTIRNDIMSISRGQTQSRD